MFKFFAFAVLLAIAGLVLESDAATFIVPPHLATHPDHPGKCWDADTKKVVNPGETITSLYCNKLICGSDFSFSGFTCLKGHISGMDCKDLPGDMTKEYPDCCPKQQCVDSEGKIFVF